MTEPTIQHMLGRIDERTQTILSEVEILKTRVSALESWRTKAVAYSSLAGSLFGFLVKWVSQ
jgi:hypothetical protein